MKTLVYTLYKCLTVFLLILAFGLVGASQAQDEVRLRIQARITPKISIAFKPFVEKTGTRLHAAIRDTINQVLVRDMKVSGVFAVRDLSVKLTDETGESVAAFLDESGEADLSLLRKLSVQIMVSGTFEVRESQIEMNLELTDVVTQRKITEKGYAAFDLTLRRVIHRVADDIVLQMTGERGVAQTRMVFTSQRTGAPELFVADYDGYNIRQLTNDRARKYSPNWSPDGTKIAYTSYRDGPHELYILDLQTGETHKVPFGGKTTLAPRWSPGGHHLVIGLVIDGLSKLFLSGLDGADLKPLITSYGINISPSWSPRGDQVAYMSDRLRDKHVYVVNVDGSDDHRITFEGKYNGSPAWSPRGDRIAFVSGDTLRQETGRLERIFNIYTCDVNGGNLMKITGNNGIEGDNVNPSWSPDGLHLLFSSDRDEIGRYNLYVMSWDGTETYRVIGDSNNRQPSWGPRP